MKIALINNYPMDRGYEQWSRGEYPAHHLWGATGLKKFDIDVEIIRHERFPFLNKLGMRIGLGDFLDQQIRLIFGARKYDLVWSACGSNTFFLALLRSVGLYRKPIVALIHNPTRFRRQWQRKAFIQGHDKLVFISQETRDQIRNEFNVTEDKLALLEWGVDMTFFDKVHREPDTPKFIVSAGKGNRDHDTIAEAFRTVDFPLRIYTSQKGAPTRSDMPSNVEVIWKHEDRNAISYTELLREYSRAYAIAIPLKRDRPGGPTSLLDALGVGKPVVVTRNPYIDIDVEKERIGFWVEPGDVEGWVQAINYLLEHPAETREMGERAYQLGKSRYNLENFNGQLAKALKQTVEADSGCSVPVAR